MKKDNHWGEAFASFLIVGLGQIMKGEGEKGLRLILAFYFVLPSLVYLSLMLNAYLFLLVLGFSLIAGTILWVYNWMDALKNQP